ncbi:MAG: hypothetical protein QXV82_09340 [Ignisphaera sp.]
MTLPYLTPTKYKFRKIDTVQKTWSDTVLILDERSKVEIYSDNHLLPFKTSNQILFVYSLPLIWDENKKRYIPSPLGQQPVTFKEPVQVRLVDGTLPSTVTVEDILNCSATIHTIVDSMPPISLPETIEVIPRPKGETVLTATGITDIDWTTILEYTVPENYRFRIAKILVSCEKDAEFTIVWGTQAIHPPTYLTGRVPHVDWFPYGTYTLDGDGTTTLQVQAKYPSTGESGNISVQVCGELTAIV